MKHTRALRLALGLAMALAPPAASAGFCSVTATNLNFTGYSPVGGPAYATGTVTVNCQGNYTSVTVGVTAANTMTSPTGATLSFSNNQTPYNTPWLSTTRMPLAVPKNGSTPATPMFYGEIPVPQNVAAATYSTTLTVTVYDSTGTYSLGSCTITVQAVVPSNCVITSGNLAFGNYDGLIANKTTPLNAPGSFSVACTLNTPCTVSLGYGANPSGTTRQMANGAARLSYQIYSDSGRTTPWTPTATVSVPANSTSTSPIPLLVYGQIPAGQSVPGGTYSDTVTITVTF